MAKSFGFFNSKDGDRRYNADHLNRMLQNLVSNGVLQNPSDNLQVFADGSSEITVRPGWASVDWHWFKSDANEKLAIDHGHPSFARIDRIIVRKDERDRTVDLMVLKGAPSSNPQPEDLTHNEWISELCLAEITVPPLSTTVLQSNVRDTRPIRHLCGYIMGLVDQVDTTTLFIQFQDAWQKYYNQSTEEFNEWFNAIKDMISYGVAVKEYKQHGQALNDMTADFEITVPFVKNFDILHFYINGMKLNADEYTVSKNIVTLRRPIDIATNYEIQVFKSIDLKSFLTIKMVDALPDTDISITTIYLLKDKSGDSYDQYLYVDDVWQNIGTTKLNLDEYQKKSPSDDVLYGLKNGELAEITNNSTAADVKTTNSNVQDELDTIKDKIPSLVNIDFGRGCIVSDYILMQWGRLSIGMPPGEYTSRITLLYPYSTMPAIMVTPDQRAMEHGFTFGVVVTTWGLGASQAFSLHIRNPTTARQNVVFSWLATGQARG